MIEYNNKNHKKEGIYKEWYNDGSIKIICDYNNNNLHGSYNHFYQNGKFKYEYYMKHGVLHGTYLEFYDNDNVKVKCNYYYGGLNGLYRYKYSNGLNCITSYYKYGKEDGIVFSYFPNGKLLSKCHMNNGLKDGKYEIYSYQNVLIELSEYNKGELYNYLKLYDNGKLKEICLYDDTQNIILNKKWYVNSKPIKEFINYGKINILTFWYPNGDILYSNLLEE